MSYGRQIVVRRALAAGLLLLLAVVLVRSTRPAAVHAADETDRAATARTQYSEKVERSYNDAFGPLAHFLPSNMQTDTGQFIDPKSFPTAAYCGHCHQESHAEWRQSAHSNSNRPPWYLKNVQLLDHEKGIAFSRHCEGCHNPVAMAGGMLTDSIGIKRHSFDDDGVTCSVCHSIQKVDTRGTGSYVLGTPAVLLDEDGKPITRPVSDGEILAHLDRHSAAVMKPFYHSAQYCSACHEAALPQQLNGYKWQRAISLYDEWQASSFAGQSPLPFYTKTSVSTCQTCHMQRAALTLPDPGAKHGTLASHRWLGANTLVPKYYGFSEQAAQVVAFLQNGAFNIDLFAMERSTPAGSKDGNAAASEVTAPLGTVPYTVASGEPVVVDVVIQNKGMAHSHVPEQRDMYESWVDFTVRDSAGKVLQESGALGADGTLESRAHSFTNRLISPQGDLNQHHQVWNTRIVAYNNTIQSGRSQLVRYGFHMPATGAVTVTAAIKYRRFNQHFIDFAMSMPDAKHYEEPVIVMTSATRTIAVGSNAPAAPGPNENPVWMRWNNYGIALLDAQQYAASVDAFAEVAKLRPDYPDAYTNQAVAEIQWERFDAAAAHLEQALALSSNNSRARYYRALVERNEGKLDAAIADLELVTRSYPESRDAHRELGFSLYQQHKYPEARVEYEKVQEIAPDDLAAHYILSILYRRLGMKSDSAREAATFADQKDDPTANTYALAYLRKHPEISNESVLWHVHELDTRETKADGALPTSFTATEQ